MRKGKKVVLIILLLLLLTVLLSVLLGHPQVFGYHLWWTPMIQSSIVGSYLFWVSLIFVGLVLLSIIAILFYPRFKEQFILKNESGTLTLDRRAIEGLVRTELNQENFVDQPKVKVQATRNMINIRVAGQIKRTSQVVNHAEDWMMTVQQKVQAIVGSEQKIRVHIRFEDTERNNSLKNNHPRVE
ncbi:alkaline shock response membrane anchor protein AmaP [Enterococcus timonensis]|uniref:alkaline shock response membrane anchor protein AmaP n=1 Tax=Enterococcus timonensis TaxID=1852364 RepID=UPI0008D8D8B0|nr:alkaline shock response membrane anchor protein AmaP [Enterococcus timonensis]